MVDAGHATGPHHRDAELRDLYERYIEAFNARDEATFAHFFHLPVSILRLPTADADAPGTAPVVVTDVAQLWPVLPPTWTRSTIDAVRIVADDVGFTPRPGFADRSPRRPALQVTVTRWAGDEPYEQVHVLYILTREGGRLGIKAMVPLAVAGAAPSGATLRRGLRGTVVNPADHRPRIATVDDAEEVARLLHDFNTEFATPSPGPEVLAARLRVLLAGDDTIAILAGRPSVAVALVTLRPNVWYAGRVALLDELYVVPSERGGGIGSAVIEQLLALARAGAIDLVEINVDEGDVDARRFYERHGFSATEPGSTERALSYAREL